LTDLADEAGPDSGDGSKWTQARYGKSATTTGHSLPGGYG